MFEAGIGINTLDIDNNGQIDLCFFDDNLNGVSDLVETIVPTDSDMDGVPDFIESDSDNDGCFDEIFDGCNGVAHVSHVSTYNDQDYVQRVCDHIINSVNKSGTVNRVVVTSSVAAVISEMDLKELVKRPVLYEDRYPDEQNPKRTPERGQGYSMGKVLSLIHI